MLVTTLNWWRLEGGWVSNYKNEEGIKDRCVSFLGMKESMFSSLGGDGGGGDFCIFFFAGSVILVNNSVDFAICYIDVQSPKHVFLQMALKMNKGLKMNKEY